MQPLINKRTNGSTNDGDKTTPFLAQNDEAAKILLPLLEYKDNLVIWNFNQCDALLDEGSFIDQLFDSQCKAIKEKRNNFPLTNAKEFSNTFHIAIEVIQCWSSDQGATIPSYHNIPGSRPKQLDDVIKLLSTINKDLFVATATPYADSQLIPIIEEFFVRSDIKADEILLVYNVMSEPSLDIPNTERAYIYYLIFLYSCFTCEYEVSQKILSALKKRFYTEQPDAPTFPILKKLNILLLSKTNPKLAISIIENELVKNPTQSQQLLLTLAAVHLEMKSYKECLGTVANLLITKENRNIYLKIKCKALYEMGFWMEALKAGEELLLANAKAPLQNCELPIIEIVTAIYRFGSVSCAEAIINRVVLTSQAKSLALYTHHPFFLNHFTNTVLNLFFNEEIKRTHPFITGITNVVPGTDFFAVTAANLISACIESVKKRKPTDKLLQGSTYNFPIPDLFYVQYLYAEKRDVPKYIRLLEEAIKYSPLHLDAQYSLAYHYLHDLFNLEALKCIQKLAFSPNPRPSWLLLMTQCEIANMNYSKAEEYCIKLLSNDPKNPAALIEQGMLLAKQNDVISATDIFTEVCVSPSATPSLIFRTIEKMIEIVPGHPNILKFLNPLLSGDKNTQLRAYFLLAKFHLENMRIDEAKKALKARDVKDSDDAYIKAKIAAVTTDSGKALSILTAGLLKDPRNLTLRKYKLDLLLFADQLDPFCNEFASYVITLPISLAPCISLLELVTERCVRQNQEQKVLHLCDLLMTKFPNHPKLVQLRNWIENVVASFQNVSKVGDNVEGIQELAEDQSEASQLVLRPLVNRNRHGYHTWTLNQDDWLLDQTIWVRQLIQGFKEDIQLRHASFCEKYKSESAEDKGTSIHYISETKTTLKYFEETLPKVLDKNEHRTRVVQLFQLMDYLYLLKLNNQLLEIINFTLSTHGQLFLTPSDTHYVHYIYLMMLLETENNAHGLARVVSYLESFGGPTTTFLEKLKILISTLYQNVPTVFLKTEKALQLIGNKSQLHSLTFLKLNFLILMNRATECAGLLAEIDPSLKTHPEYLRVQCILDFTFEQWDEARKIAEIYFQLDKNEKLSRQGLQIALILSVIYRYNATIGDGVLFSRLQKTLNNPNQKILLESSAFVLFSQIVMNFALNSSVNISPTEYITYLEYDHSLMALAKKNIMFTLIQLNPVLRNVHPHYIEFSKKLEDEPCQNTYLLPDLGFHLATKHFVNDNLDEALAMANSVLESSPMHFETIHLKAAILNKKDETLEAVRLLTLFLDKKLNSPKLNREFLLLLCSCFSELGYFNDALDRINEGLKINSLDTQFLLMKGDILVLFDDLTEARKCLELALQLSQDRSFNLHIIQTLVHAFPDFNSEFLLGFFKILVNGSNDEIEFEARRLRCQLFVKTNKIAELKNELAYFTKKDYQEFYIEAHIEAIEDRVENALEILKKCQKLLNKKQKEVFSKQNIFFDINAEIRLLKLVLYQKMANYSAILNDQFEWITLVTPKRIGISALNLFLNACQELESELNKKILQRGLLVAQGMQKKHPGASEMNLIIERISEFMQVSESKKDIIPIPIITKSVTEEKPQSEGTPSRVIEVVKPILFDFIHKPNLYQITEKETPKEIAKTKIHPAKIKMMEQEEDLAKKLAIKEIKEMYEKDPTQLDVGMTMSQIFKQKYGEFVLEEEMKEMAPKPAAKPPKETPNSATRLSAVKSIPSSEPILVPPEHLDRFELAHNYAIQLRDCLKTLADSTLRVHPIYRNEEFASRLMLLHLFRLVELLKPPKANSLGKNRKESNHVFPSIDLFSVNVQKIMSIKDIRLLRNLIVLNGHRLGFKDLINFCQSLIDGKVKENLECLTKRQVPQDPYVELKISNLFPFAFHDEWLTLNSAARINVLIEVINFELNFVRDIYAQFSLDIRTDKGKDALEVLKASVLRIGKSLSRIKKELHIEKFSDNELNRICKASINIRHQIMGFTLMGLPEELQPKWLEKFMRNHAEIREKINHII